jgi:hypothetical protein
MARARPGHLPGVIKAPLRHRRRKIDDEIDDGLAQRAGPQWQRPRRQEMVKGLQALWAGKRTPKIEEHPNSDRELKKFVLPGDGDAVTPEWPYGARPAAVHFRPRHRLIKAAHSVAYPFCPTAAVMPQLTAATTAWAFPLRSVGAQFKLPISARSAAVLVVVAPI